MNVDFPSGEYNFLKHFPYKVVEDALIDKMMVKRILLRSNINVCPTLSLITFAHNLASKRVRQRHWLQIFEIIIGRVTDELF